MRYVWFIWSLNFLAVWAALFLLNKRLRKEMLWASLWTSLLGLTEPLFIGDYWNPPTLFNLAGKTGFDIESIIFSFAAGGLASVIYESIFKVKHVKISKQELYQNGSRLGRFAVALPFITFALLVILTKWSHIYCGILGMILGVVLAFFSRPDLKKKMFISGFLFLGLYFLFFLSLVAAYPDYVVNVWNLERISGILIFGIPVEELLFGFFLGMLWSTFYEQIYSYKITT